MSYRNPTPLEIRMSQRLASVASWLDKRLAKRFEGRADFMLIVTPFEGREDIPDHPADWPVVNYIANHDRESSAKMLMQLLIKWQNNEDVRPLHELTDEFGNSLGKQLGFGPH